MVSVLMGRVWKSETVPPLWQDFCGPILQVLHLMGDFDTQGRETHGTDQWEGPGAKDNFLEEEV